MFLKTIIKGIFNNFPRNMMIIHLIVAFLFFNFMDTAN